MSASTIQWSNVCPGIDFAVGTNQTCPPQYPTPNVNLLRVDLTNPAISLLTTPADLLQPSGVQTTALLQSLFDPGTMTAMFAVNANFFDMNLRTTFYGLSISSADQVNGADSGYPCEMQVNQANNAAILDIAADIGAPPPGPIWTAAAAQPLLVHQGSPYNWQPFGPTIAARTLIGLSAPDETGYPQYLYLITIDGLETQDYVPPPYYGATLADAANWLIAAGAQEGFNFDGGGSTTMAAIGIEGVDTAVLLNFPHDNESSPEVLERYVATSFVVIVAAP
jgi:phosphodiester glycosidase